MHLNLSNLSPFNNQEQRLIFFQQGAGASKSLQKPYKSFIGDTPNFAKLSARLAALFDAFAEQAHLPVLFRIKAITFALAAKDCLESEYIRAVR